MSAMTRPQLVELRAPHCGHPNAFEAMISPATRPAAGRADDATTLGSMERYETTS